MSSTPSAVSARSIPLAAITFSTTTAQKERRARFDKAALKELAESIKSVGVAQAILVRPAQVWALPCGHAIVGIPCSTSELQNSGSLPTLQGSSTARDVSGPSATGFTPSSRKASGTTGSSSADGSNHNGALEASTASGNGRKSIGGPSGRTTSQLPEKLSITSPPCCPICSSAKTTRGELSKPHRSSSTTTRESDGQPEKSTSSDPIPISAKPKSPDVSDAPRVLSETTAVALGYRLVDQDGHPAESSWEIVAGERRVIAAKQAGLEEIPATVRELTDDQVLELQLIENLQREDLHELAEAEGYEQLGKRGHSVDEIAAKVGKSRGTVYARMKLLALIPEARKAYYDGKLSASTALYIARISPAAVQKQALADITKPQGYGDEKAPMTARQAQKHIHDNYMLRLSDAGFKTSDPDLVPSAGACGPCPKRTGNQPELFGDVKSADVCTDPTCFKQKIAAHAERAIAAAAETGQKVLAGPEAKKVAKYGIDSHSLEGYVRLDDRDYRASSTKPRTFRQVLGKDYVPTLLQDPDTGKLIQVAPNKDVDKAHGDGHLASNDKHAREYAEKQRAAERKHRQRIAYRCALFKAVHDAGVSRKALSRAELERTADRLFERLDHDSKKRLFAALGWEVKKAPSGYGTEFPFPTPIEKMADGELAQTIRDCAVAHELQVWQHSGETRPKDLEAAAAELGVDFKKIARELEAAAREKAAKKKPAAKASGKKAKSK